MTRSTLTGPAAGLLLLAAVTALVLQQLGRDGPVDLAPARGLGEVLAIETARLLPRGGRVAVIIHPPDASAHARAQWDTFQKELARHPTLRVTAIEELPSEQLMTGPSGVVETPALAEAIARHGDVDAVVSHVGCANLGPRAAAGSQRPPLLALCSATGPVLASLLANGSVQVALVPKQEPPPPPGATTHPPPPAAPGKLGPRDWVARHYEVVRP